MEDFHHIHPYPSEYYPYTQKTVASTYFQVVVLKGNFRKYGWALEDVNTLVDGQKTPCSERENALKWQILLIPSQGRFLKGEISPPQSFGELEMPGVKVVVYSYSS
jgi:hypothetical protein